MRSDVLDKSDFIEHNDLWNKGQRLKPESVAPCKLPRSKTCIYDHSEDEGSWEKYFEVREVISELIISLQQS